MMSLNYTFLREIYGPVKNKEIDKFLTRYLCLLFSTVPKMIDIDGLLLCFRLRSCKQLPTYLGAVGPSLPKMNNVLYSICIEAVIYSDFVIL